MPDIIWIESFAKSPSLIKIRSRAGSETWMKATETPVRARLALAPRHAPFCCVTMVVMCKCAPIPPPSHSKNDDILLVFDPLRFSCLSKIC